MFQGCRRTPKQDELQITALAPVCAQRPRRLAAGWMHADSQLWGARRWLPGALLT